MADKKSLATAVGGVLFNAMNYPERVQSRMLGQDIRPLTGKVLDAILEWLADHDREVAARGYMAGWTHARTEKVAAATHSKGYAAIRSGRVPVPKEESNNE